MTEEVPRLSPSIAHNLTTECALSAWSSHRLLGNNRKEATDSQWEGRLWHAALLEGGKGVEVLYYDNFKTKAAREERDVFRRKGMIPVPAPKWENMKHSIERIQEQLAIQDVVFDGKVEERIEWIEQSTITRDPVLCSGYIDHRRGYRIDDLKTGKGFTSLHKANGLIAKSHALLQDAAYRRASAQLHGGEPEDYDVWFVFVQTDEPYSVTPVRMNVHYRELSYMRWQRAINEWSKCLTAGTDRKYWPGPVGPEEKVAELHPPAWMVNEEHYLELMES